MAVDALFADRDVALEAVAQNWEAIEWVPPRIIDRSLAQVAVQQNWRALYWAPPHLCGEHSLVLGAVSCSGKALKLDSDDLREDRGVIL